MVSLRGGAVVRLGSAVARVALGGSAPPVASTGTGPWRHPRQTATARPKPRSHPTVRGTRLTPFAVPIWRITSHRQEARSLGPTYDQAGVSQEWPRARRSSPAGERSQAHIRDGGQPQHNSGHSGDRDYSSSPGQSKQNLPLAGCPTRAPVCIGGQVLGRSMRQPARARQRRTCRLSRGYGGRPGPRRRRVNSSHTTRPVEPKPSIDSPGFRRRGARADQRAGVIQGSWDPLSAHGVWSFPPCWAGDLVGHCIGPHAVAFFLGVVSRQEVAAEQANLGVTG